MFAHVIEFDIVNDINCMNRVINAFHLHDSSNYKEKIVLLPVYNAPNVPGLKHLV